ncbi:molecular chaperone DnaK [Rhodobacteraceae bacterium WD3A24]|nr:molecular chaperone DnaK [Rhodobacteraceae bacterium WD3A24]
MDQSRIEAFRRQLEEMLAGIEADDAAGAEGQRTVTLDQQSVGRLSRMDAMQQQAMAKAQAGRRAVMRKRIHAALARIEAGEFGYCEECGEEIPPRRLELDPTLPRCVSCAASG